MTHAGITGPAADDGRDDDGLYQVVYAELKRIARHHRRAAGSQDTLCTTELVHEAYLRLSRADGSPWQNRAHFFGAASRAMRQVLVDFARQRNAIKRGGGWNRVSLGKAEPALDVELDEILTLDAALDRLNAVSERLRQVVELRFFAGMPEDEVAELLGVTPRTVERDWLKARLFLLDVLVPARANVV
jgi:RNA polymerase sigma factor (TIGR02999 family)